MICVIIIIGEDIDASAKRFCEEFRSENAAVREIPIVYNKLNGDYYCPKFSGIWGLLFHNRYREIVADALRLTDNQYKHINK